MIQIPLRTAENNPTSAPLPLVKPHSLSKAELSSSSCTDGDSSKKPGVSSWKSLLGLQSKHEIAGYEVVTAYSGQGAGGDLLWPPSSPCCLQLFPFLQAASACHGEHWQGCDTCHSSQFKSKAGKDFMESIGGKINKDGTVGEGQDRK